MAVVADPKHSFPDIPKLQAMGKRLVFASKVIGPNREQGLIHGTDSWRGASVESILGLPAELARQHGTGMYHFRVVDESGTSPDTVEWWTRLGSGPDNQEVGMPPIGATGSDQVIHNLGSGFTYNESLGLLTTRDGRVFQWTRGEPLPDLTPVRMGGATSPAAFGYSPVPPDAGGGGIAALLQREEERRRDDESRRREEETRRMFAESQARFEALVAKLTERPSGPSPETEALKAQIAALERQREDDRRREEARAAEERHRVEMVALTSKMDQMFAASQQNKQDPMLMMFGQIITSMQQSVTASAGSGEKIAGIITDRLAGSVMTPDRMMEMLRIAKDRGADQQAMNYAMEMYQRLFGMSQDVLRMQSEMMQGNQPQWWESAIEKIGTVGQAVVENRERAAAEQRNQQEQRARAVAMAQARQRAQQQPPVETPPAAAPQPSAAAPMNGAGNGAPKPAAVPDQVVPPKKRKRRKKAGEALDYSTVSDEELRSITDTMTDEVFFGPFLPYVVDRVRNPLAKNALSFFEAAKFVLGSRQYFQQAAAAGQFPPAAELLVAGKLEVLISRLMPEAAPVFQQQVVDSLRAQLQAEGGGGPGADQGADEDGEDEDGDDGDETEETAPPV